MTATTIASPRPGRATDLVEGCRVAEFGRAIESYKRRRGRQFPTWCEILQVLRDLGYAKHPLGGPPRVRVNEVDARGERIKAALARCGGVPSWRGGASYEFRSEEVRDLVLEVIRSAFGWTCVDPG